LILERDHYLDHRRLEFQRHHHGTFNQRRSLLAPPERSSSSRNHVRILPDASSVKLNDVEADAIARPGEPDHLDIEVGFRSGHQWRFRRMTS
jgi:hypothetical protein